MRESDLHGLHAAHGKAGDGTAVLVGLDRIIALNERDDIGHHVFGKRRDLVRNTGHGAVRHDHHHRDHLAFRQEVVQDPARCADTRPGGIVVTAAVDQVQDRKLGLGFLIAGRRPDMQAAHALQGPAVIPALGDRTMGHILHGEEFIAGGLHFQQGPGLPCQLGFRIVDGNAVDGELIAVDARVNLGDTTFPDSVFLLFKTDRRAPREVAGYGDLLRLGSINLEDHAASVHDRGTKGVIRGGTTAPSLGKGVAGDQQRHQKDQSSFHNVSF